MKVALMRFISNVAIEEPIVFQHKGNVLDEGCFLHTFK